MTQSLALVWIHVIFSTKERRPLLQSPVFCSEMFRMLAHQVKEQNCVSGAVGGYLDHVHLLVGLSRCISVAKLVERLKVTTSRWAKINDNGHAKFCWQSGYGAFSVSHSLRGVVDRYIRNQAIHHAAMSYQDEFRLICRKHGIEIDERYAWT